MASAELPPAVVSGLAEHIGGAPRATSSVAGGDINAAHRVQWSDGQRLLVKTHADPPPGFFVAEAEGLRWLAEPGVIDIAQVVCVSDDPPFLALRFIESAPPAADHDETLGRGLADLHRHQPGGFGLDRDNFIGRLPQSNRRCDDWPTFYRTQRLQPQIDAAADLLGPDLLRRFERLWPRLADRCGPTEPPARLHGDLWGGNAIVGERGQPVLIDPAVYGGHREVDLAMMQLFGGFSSRCFAAYDEAHPLAPRWRERVPLYQLYPLLVHVNLFGGGYVGSVASALRSVE